MKKTCLLSLVISLALVLPSALHAQATAAATRGGIAQAGVAYTISNEDEYPGRAQDVPTPLTLTPWSISQY